MFTVYETGRRYRVTVLSGSPAAVSGAQQLGTAERGITLAGDRAWEIAIEEYDSARPPYRTALTFDQIAAAADAEFTPVRRRGRAVARAPTRPPPNSPHTSCGRPPCARPDSSPGPRS